MLRYFKISILFTIPFIALFTPPSSHASLSTLFKEYMKVNLELNSQKNNAKLTKEDYLSFKSSKDLSLFASVIELDSTLESSTSFSSFKSDSTQYQLGLSKDFFWGGNLNFVNTYSKNSIITDSEIYNFSQTLSYSQDLWNNFFGRNDKIKLETLSMTFDLENLKINSVEEEKLLLLVNSYLNCLELLKTQKLLLKSLERSIKRENMIKRRVRDGLNIKADLYNIKSVTLLKREELKSNKINIEKSFKDLSMFFHRMILKKEVIDDKYTLQGTEDLKNNKKLLLLDQGALVERSRLTMMKNALWPKLKFEAGYTTNDFDPTSSKVIKNGRIDGENNELKLALSLNWQFGSNSAKALKNKAMIRLENIKYQKTQTQKNIKLSNEAALKEFKLRLELIKLAKKRLVFMKLTLKEYNRLYKNGKADLDQVISSEENLIETKRRLLRANIESQRMVFFISSLNGSLIKMISKKSEQ